MKLFKKYEFNSEAQALEKINALPYITDEDGNKHLKDNHSIVKLGNLILNIPEYDEDLNEIVAPIYSEKYSVDVMWDNLNESPYGWKSYEIQVEGNGVHTFAGWNF